MWLLVDTSENLRRHIQAIDILTANRLLVNFGVRRRMRGILGWDPLLVLLDDEPPETGKAMNVNDDKEDQKDQIEILFQLAVHSKEHYDLAQLC